VRASHLAQVTSLLRQSSPACPPASQIAEAACENVNDAKASARIAR